MRRELTRISCQGTLFPPSRIPNVFFPNKVVEQKARVVFRKLWAAGECPWLEVGEKKTLSNNRNWGRGAQNPAKRFPIIFVGHWTSSIFNRQLLTYLLHAPPSSLLLYLFSSSHYPSCLCVLLGEPHSVLLEDTLIDCTFHRQLSPPLLTTVTRSGTAAVAAETLR